MKLIAAALCIFVIFTWTSCSRTKNVIIDLSKGDILQGIIYKSDSSNFTDALVFKILIDDVEQTAFTRNILIPTELGGISFQLNVQ